MNWSLAAPKDFLKDGMAMQLFQPLLSMTSASPTTKPDNAPPFSFQPFWQPASIYNWILHAQGGLVSMCILITIQQGSPSPLGGETFRITFGLEAAGASSHFARVDSSPSIQPMGVEADNNRWVRISKARCNLRARLFI